MELCSAVRRGLAPYKNQDLPDQQEQRALAGVSRQGALAPQVAGAAELAGRRDPTRNEEERGDCNEASQITKRPLFLDLPHSWLEQTGYKLAPSTMFCGCKASGWTKAQPYGGGLLPLQRFTVAGSAAGLKPSRTEGACSLRDYLRGRKSWLD